MSSAACAVMQDRACLSHRKERRTCAGADLFVTAAACACRSFGDVCQYKLVSSSDDEAPLIWQDRWSHELCQCDQ